MVALRAALDGNEMDLEPLAEIIEEVRFKGKRSRVILFADLKGSTRMWERPARSKERGPAEIQAYRQTVLHNLSYILTLDTESFKSVRFVDSLLTDFASRYGNKTKPTETDLASKLCTIWEQFLKKHGLSQLTTLYKASLVKQIGDEVMMVFGPNDEQKPGTGMPCHAALCVCLFAQEVLTLCSEEGSHWYDRIHNLISLPWPPESKAVLHWAEDLLDFDGLDFLGREVNRASRLASIPQGGQIIASGTFKRQYEEEASRETQIDEKVEVMLRKYERSFSAMPASIHAMKGISEPLEIYPLCNTAGDMFDLSVGITEAIVFLHVTDKFELDLYSREYRAEITHTAELLDHHRYLLLLRAPALDDYIKVILENIIGNGEIVNATYSHFTHSTQNKLTLNPGNGDREFIKEDLKARSLSRHLDDKYPYNVTYGTSKTSSMHLFLCDR
ncbi:MAG: hypothetical protein ACLQPD_08210 [Desulfomonilaceae bacterium]